MSLSFVVVSAVILLASATRIAETLKGLTCKDHPLYKKHPFRGEIIRSWSYTQTREKVFKFSDSAYVPRYTQHGWSPMNNLSSTEYTNLDLFTTYMQRDGPDHYLTISFQRPAKVYLFVAGFDRAMPRAQLSGWDPKGWAAMTKNTNGNGKAQVGLMSKKEFPVMNHAFVFSKPAATNVQLPSMAWVAKNVRGMKSNGYYIVLVGEADGSSVRPPRARDIPAITAGKRCPAELHDAWRVRGFDQEDQQTRNRMFRTYHPMWDPCFWCAYDHEHGSAAYKLMGYAPRYGYAALKNDNEDESHGGFKDYVLDIGEHRLLYSIHAHLSLPRRFFTRFHSVVIVIADTKTNEILAHFNYKADFGFTATKAAKGGMLPLTKADEKLQQLQQQGNETKGFREVNILDVNNLDPRVLYRTTGKKLLKGEYERWMAYPICSSRKIRGPVADFKGAQSALRTTSSGADDTVELGRYLHGIWRPNNAVNRDLRFRGWEIGVEHCQMENLRSKNGIFYTDPYGKKLVEGPAPNAMRQFIKPGFRLWIPDGIYMVDDTWLGLGQEGYIGGMVDIMNAIDASKN